jgi:hypothetical protein
MHRPRAPLGGPDRLLERAVAPIIGLWTKFIAHVSFGCIAGFRSRGFALSGCVLCLPQIKSGHVGSAVRPESGDRKCVRLSRRRVISARPCSMTMGARAVVVAHVREQHVTQMAFAKYHDMINAFPADRADQPFCISVLPGRARRRRAVSNTDGSGPTDEHLAVGAIAVPDQVTRGLLPAARLGTLPEQTSKGSHDRNPLNHQNGNSSDVSDDCAMVGEEGLEPSKP